MGLWHWKRPRDHAKNALAARIVSTVYQTLGFLHSREKIDSIPHDDSTKSGRIGGLKFSEFGETPTQTEPTQYDHHYMGNYSFPVHCFLDFFL